MLYYSEIPVQNLIVPTIIQQFKNYKPDLYSAIKATLIPENVLLTQLHSYVDAQDF